MTQSFARHGLPLEANRVELIAGLFQDTIHLDEPVAFAHLDGDWHESIRTCLERIVPHLSVGGRLVIDDYFAWSGWLTAVDEYFAGGTSSSCGACPGCTSCEWPSPPEAARRASGRVRLRLPVVRVAESA